jgi:hypothetical protein
MKKFERLYAFFAPRIDALLGKIEPTIPAGDDEFDRHADWAIASQTPQGARRVVWFSGAVFFVLLIWANIWLEHH